MIRYALSCAEGHRFESWFRSADAFDALLASGRVTCAVCGGARVEKCLMAPGLGAERDAAAPEAAPERPLSRPANPAEQALADLRRRIETESDYVGLRFAQQAREMHEGLTPRRTIHGEARFDEAKKLIEEGVPIAPLPFTPGRKTN